VSRAIDRLGTDVRFSGNVAQELELGNTHFQHSRYDHFYYPRKQKPRLHNAKSGLNVCTSETI